MKKILFVLNVALGLTILPMACVSCSDDDELSGEQQGAEDQQAVTIKIESGEEENDLPEGTGLELFFFGADASVASYEMTVGEENENPMPGLQDGMSVCAYSPTSGNLFTEANCQEPQRFSVVANQSDNDGYEGSSLMIAPMTQVVNGRADLKMRRMMAKVTVHVTDVTGHYNLNSLDMTMRNRYTSVMANLQTATVTPVTDGDASLSSRSDGSNKADLAPYVTTRNGYRVSASVIVPPGQIEKGNELVYMTIDGQEFAYDMAAAEEWSSGKEYVYSMRLTNEGLVPYGSEVVDWTEGENDLTGAVETKVPYTVGDYITADGEFLRRTELESLGIRDDVAAIVFSTEVSEADAEAGYDAYAMAVEPQESVGWVITDVIDVSVASFTDALANLDGRTHTEDILESDAYTGLEDKSRCVFKYAEDKEPIQSETASCWFVPTFGQMIQILNNLGEAGITAETSLNESNPGSVALYVSANRNAINKVNGSCEALGKFPFRNIGVYVTVTESGSQFWNVNVHNDRFEFGRSAYKNGTSRNVLYCVAVKLPEI